MRKLISSTALQVTLVLIAVTWVAQAVYDAAAGSEGLWHRFGAWGLGFAIPFQAAVAISPFPSEVIALANASVFGFWLGFLCNWSAWMIMAGVPHPLARRAVVDFYIDKRRMPQWLRRFPVGHPAYLILGRYLPWGNHMVNLSAGAVGVPLPRLLWCTAVREIPVALFFAALGSGLISVWR